ncbi:MAG TPA: High-affnity carbon uptake protein Hat/HatR [Chryseosolibacter sp.]|nr:High-affnity carbon uptake protein Hat/HatR [Chryseosolibacter sp.]
MSQALDQQVLVAPNPFPGLRPFKIEESHLFFGREGQSDEVLLKMSKNRFVGVIGPSGSGKSSFIYCGVMPILYGGFLTDASPNWEVVVTRPGGGPIDNLAESLLKNNKDYIAADAEERKIKRTIFSTLLRSSSLGLVEAIEQTRKQADVNYLVLVDQFEELFRFKDSFDPNSVNETLAFVNLLIEAVNYPDSPIYVAITMRSDFIGDCAQFPELTRKINDSHYLIPQLTRDQKRRAIEGPVAVGGARITPRLTQQLLNDLGDNPDQLPILQHALMRTWSYWATYKDVDDEALDLKHYEAIGTMAEALSMHANEAFDELTEDQKRICEVLFKAITEKRGENFGIRRPTKLNEIAAIADVSEEDVIGVIEKFREPGRSLITPAHGTPLKSKSIVDISHESLMRIWVRLKNWVDDEAEAVQMYTRLAEAAAMHQVGKAGLWRPPDLQLALNWQAKHKPTLVWGQRYNPAFERTMIFLEYSKKEWETEQRIKELEQKRKLQRARITAIVLGSATIISLVFLVYAFLQKIEADKAREQAQKNEQVALEAQAATEKQRQLAEAAKIDAEKQKEIAIIQQKEAERQKQLALENEKKAKENEVRANQERDRAEIERRNAEEQRKLAIKREEEATAARKDAEARRYLALAKAMAIKSKDVPDKELQSLLAQHAYNWNKRYAGYPYDNEIYNGLYKALEKNEHALTANLAGHEQGACRSLSVHLRSGTIFSGGSDGRILRWTHANQKWTPQILVGSRAEQIQIYSVDVSEDGRLLIAGGMAAGESQANFVELYDLNNVGAGPKKLSGFTHSVDNLIFSPDDNGFYARDNAGMSIKYSDLNTVKEIIKPAEKINSIALSPDGKLLAGAGNEGSLYIWDVRNNYASKVLYKNPQVRSKPIGLSSVGFRPNGKEIVIGDVLGFVKIFSVENASNLRVLSGHRATIEHIVFNHNGPFMATTSNDKTVRLWNLDKLNQQPIVLDDHEDWVRTAIFSADDEQLLAGINSNAEKAEETIHAWPTKIETMSGLLCAYISRRLTEDEWDIYVDDDDNIKSEPTCEGSEKKK